MSLGQNILTNMSGLQLFALEDSQSSQLPTYVRDYLSYTVSISPPISQV